MRISIAVLGCLLLAAGLSARADSTAPTTQPIKIDPTDAEAVKAASGQDVVVEGKIVKSTWSQSGKVMQARFGNENDSLQLVVFEKDKEHMDKAFGGDVAQALDGANVRAEGKIKEYRGRPEIVIDTPDQLTILTRAATQATTQP